MKENILHLKEHYPSNKNKKGQNGTYRLCRYIQDKNLSNKKSLGGQKGICSGMKYTYVSKYKMSFNISFRNIILTNISFEGISFIPICR